MVWFDFEVNVSLSDQSPLSFHTLILSLFLHSILHSFPDTNRVHAKQVIFHHVSEICHTVFLIEVRINGHTPDSLRQLASLTLSPLLS